MDQLLTGLVADNPNRALCRPYLEVKEVSEVLGESVRRTRVLVEYVSKRCRTDDINTDDAILEVDRTTVTSMAECQFMMEGA